MESSRPGSQAIIAGWLIDGAGGPAGKNMVMEIENGYIRRIRQATPDDFRRSDILNFSDHTILPGLIDSHVHLFMSGTDNREIREHQLDAPFEDMKDVIGGHICAHFAHGVVAVRDGGDRKAHALRYRSEIYNYAKTPVFLKLAGKAWRKPGRYGRLIGRSPREGETLAASIMRETSDIWSVRSS